MCNEIENTNQKSLTTKTEIIDKYCQKNATILPKLNCKYKYLNRTLIRTTPLSSSLFADFIEETNVNWQYDASCDECNIQYNFHYQDYCIANGLLRPYLSYNSFWQFSSKNQHFGDLKFVAFFCLALHNQTACNQLANLCVLSHYANDKNSPCSKFLLNQASDVVYRYGSVDEHMGQQQMKPFLYYRKGKESLAQLVEPIQNLKYTLDAKQKVSVVYL